jgi:hypothetical protein
MFVYHIVKNWNLQRENVDEKKRDEKDSVLAIQLFLINLEYVTF